MDLNFITELYVPIVIAACLIVGYIIKKWLPCDNKIIPTALALLGAVLGCVAAQEITLIAIVAGAASGLASTGLHQAFKQLIGDKDEDEDIESPDIENEEVIDTSAEDAELKGNLVPAEKDGE